MILGRLSAHIDQKQTHNWRCLKLAVIHVKILEISLYVADWSACIIKTSPTSG